jgi:hypothetical protein
LPGRRATRGRRGRNRGLALTKRRSHQALGHWHVKRDGNTVTILGPNSSVIAVLPTTGPDDSPWLTPAHVMAAAPQLLKVCIRMKSVLENNLVVPAEGFKSNCSDIQGSPLNAILRAAGSRKTPRRTAAFNRLPSLREVISAPPA